MKVARPIIIGSFAFSITFAVLALVYLATAQLLTSPIAASANPTHAVSAPTRIAASDAGETAAKETNIPVPSETPVPTATDTPTPTGIPPVAPPTPPPASSAAFQQGMTLRTNADYANAAVSFRAVLSENPDPALARQAQFRLGETLWLSGKLDDAAVELGKLIAANGADGLAMRAHYFLAQVLTAQKKYGAAVDHLRVYRAQTRSLAGEMDAEIADDLLAMGDDGGAMKQYGVALADPTLTNAQRVHFLIKLSAAYIALGSPAEAAARLEQAFGIAPDEKNAAEAEYKWGLALDALGKHAQAVAHWQHTVSEYPEQDDGYNALVALVNAGEPVDDYVRGVVDYNADAYDAAATALSRYVNANPGKNAAALYYLGRSYMGSDNYTAAIRSFDNLLKGYPKDTHAADAAYYKARSYAGLGDTTGAVSAYNSFAAAFPRDSRADDAMWSAARLLDLDDRTDEARAQYQKLAAAFPKSTYASTALFNIGLDSYFNDDSPTAEQIWQDLAAKYPNTVDADHALFWLGKLALSGGDKAKGQAFLQEAAKPPRSYYSYRALDLLGRPDVGPSFDASDYTMNARPEMVAEFEKWLAGWTGGAPVSSGLTAAVQGDFYFRRGAELAELDQSADARIEFAKVDDRFAADARSLYGLARYYSENNYFDLSIAVADRIKSLSGQVDEQLPRYLRELLYPTYYANLVVPYAQRGGYDPMLFFALMRQESMYNPLAKSWVGATGLTQVMPGTGAGIARELGVSNFKIGDLLKPYNSVRFGTYYLGQLFKSFGGNAIYALAGYNAGPGNVKKWVRPDMDVAVELIHLSETYHYVRTIYSQYNQYQEIYGMR